MTYTSKAVRPRPWPDNGNPALYRPWSTLHFVAGFVQGAVPKEHMHRERVLKALADAAADLAEVAAPKGSKDG